MRSYSNLENAADRLLPRAARKRRCCWLRGGPGHGGVERPHWHAGLLGPQVILIFTMRRVGGETSAAPSPADTEMTLAGLQVQPASLRPARPRARAHPVLSLLRYLHEKHGNWPAPAPGRIMAAVHGPTRPRRPSPAANPRASRTVPARQYQRRARPRSALVLVALREESEDRCRQPIIAVESLPLGRNGERGTRHGQRIRDSAFRVPRSAFQKVLAPLRTFSVSIRDGWQPLARVLRSFRKRKTQTRC